MVDSPFQTHAVRFLGEFTDYIDLPLLFSETPLCRVFFIDFFLMHTVFFCLKEEKDDIIMSTTNTIILQNELVVSVWLKQN